MDSNIEQLTEFDSLISPKQLQIIKSALPYIPLNDRKVISLIVKFQELKNTLHLYDNTSDETLGICSSNENINENLAEMVDSIKHYCTDSEKENLDFYYNVACAFNLSRACAEDCKDSSENDGFDAGNILKSMLSPEQQTLLESCSLMFGLNK